MFASDPPDLQAAAYRRLALSVFEQAICDACKSGIVGSDARIWLELDGLAWAEQLGLGLQPAKFREWLASGCPK
jgi:hypothetical protein